MAKKNISKGRKVAAAVLSTIVCIIAIVVIVAILSEDSDSPSNNVSAGASTTQSTSSKQSSLIVDQNNVKISVKSTSKTFGFEMLNLQVENNSSKDVIVQISDVSVNNAMTVVIQPQSPLHITASGKNSVLPFNFASTKLKGATVEFNVEVRDENFNMLFTTKRLTIQL